ncbi:hypothetical protein BJF79_30180 [Actinomadura sp. CNU-125]|nr:hypothetical protein BJF79_30180 [Actinomadura sp. CNU-125]
MMRCTEERGSPVRRTTSLIDSSGVVVVNAYRMRAARASIEDSRGGAVAAAGAGMGWFLSPRPDRPSR